MQRLNLLVLLSNMIMCEHAHEHEDWSIRINNTNSRQVEATIVGGGGA